MVPGHALGTHGAEPIVQTGPELLQAHPSTLARRTGRPPQPPAGYRRPVVPSTGSGALDVVLQIGIMAALLVTIVLLIRNYRDR